MSKKLTIDDFRSKKQSLKNTIKPTNWHKSILGNVLKIKDKYSKHIDSTSEKIIKEDYIPWYTSVFACFHPIKAGQSLIQRFIKKVA